MKLEWRSGESSEGLIGVLLDKHAPDGDRDDAAGDLSKYDDPQVEAALITVSSDPATDPYLVETCGESLGEIWVRTGFVKPTVFLQLQSAAQRFVIAWLWAERPDLVEKIERDTGINPVHEYWALREAGFARPPDQLDALPAYLCREVPGFADCPDGRTRPGPPKGPGCGSGGLWSLRRPDAGGGRATPPKVTGTARRG